ncbi:hypothetical protein TREES_T100000664 [Tupaia chinensis]|uniref:Uncharacterized protein n=1 Tax=Tupaia chinensis TaxID=246437 RepID=L9KNJ2_TUPCH|nr:hypothetical protein TREES_T100000664 [Tupaia chinensis]
MNSALGLWYQQGESSACVCHPQMLPLPGNAPAVDGMEQPLLEHCTRGRLEGREAHFQEEAFQLRFLVAMILTGRGTFEPLLTSEGMAREREIASTGPFICSSVTGACGVGAARLYAGPAGSTAPAPHAPLTFSSPALRMFASSFRAPASPAPSSFICNGCVLSIEQVDSGAMTGRYGR